MRKAAVLALTVVALTFAACSSGSGGAHPAAVTTTTSTANLTALFTGLSAEVAAAANTYVEQSQEDQDYSQYPTITATYEQALSIFIGQMVGINWPSKYNKAVNAVVDTARTLRSDLASGGTITPATPSSETASINPKSATDRGNFSDALSVLKARVTRYYFNGTPTQ